MHITRSPAATSAGCGGARARTSDTVPGMATAKPPAARKVAKKQPTSKAAAKKSTAKKSTAKKLTKKPARHPFPFLGAGQASYFEWGGLYVWFEAPPPRAARAKLLKAIPEPFRHDAAWGGKVLHASSGDQFTNLHICTAYAKLGDPEEDRGDPGDDDYMDGLDYGVGEPFPNSRQMRAFEADLVQWLLALHRKHPIAFVARREDSEAGGTKLNAWHRWSLEQFASVVLPRIEDHIRKPGPKLEGWAVHEALDVVLDAAIKDQVPPAVQRWREKDR